MHYLSPVALASVGAYVVRDLRAGHLVTIYDLALNREFLYDVLMDAAPQGVDLIAGDVTDLPLLLRSMSEAHPTRVVHLAATLGSSSETNPLRALESQLRRHHQCV